MWQGREEVNGLLVKKKKKKKKNVYKALIETRLTLFLHKSQIEEIF